MEIKNHIEDYIMMHRRIPEWLEKSPYTLHLLGYFARRARRDHSENVNWNGEIIHLEIRQFITGRISGSEKLGIKENQYRTAYRKLIQQGLICTIRSTKRYTIAEYHGDAVFNINVNDNIPSDEPSVLPSKNQQITTNNKEVIKNNKKYEGKPRFIKEEIEYKQSENPSSFPLTNSVNPGSGHKKCQEIADSLRHSFV